jgi:hypothetical protein
MRGSTLILHTLEALDPDRLDRVEDLEEALDPLNPPSIYCYPDIEIITRDHSSSSTSRQNKSHPSQIASLNHSYSSSSSSPSLSKETDTKPSSRQNLGRSHSHHHHNHSQSHHLLDLFTPGGLSSSPPLTKSNYYISEEDFYEENLSDSSSTCSSCGDSRRSNMSFHSSNHGKTFTSLGSGMPLSRLKSDRNDGSSNSFSIKGSRDTFGNQSRYDYNNNEQSSFTKFFGLKSSSNKNDKNRFDINKLPPQLKDELKRIYVY